nr:MULTISPECIES: spore coat protein GerQ [Jeotgalibacillus]
MNPSSMQGQTPPPTYYPYYQQTYPQQQQQQMPAVFPREESYIENIFRLNRGKMTTVYMTFENNREWNAKIFKGVIEAAGRDHLILSDPKTNQRYLLPLLYMDYATFDGEINYAYPYNGVTNR